MAKAEAAKKVAKPDDYPVITGADKRLYLTVGKGQGEKDPHLSGTMLVGGKSISVAGYVGRNEKTKNPYIKLTAKNAEGGFDVVGYGNRAKDKDGKALNYLIFNDTKDGIFHAFLSNNAGASDAVKQMVTDVSEHFNGLKPSKTAAERAAAKAENDADSGVAAKKKKFP